MLEEIAEALEGCEITGIHCSACDHMITVHGSSLTNEDFFDAASMHHAKFHSNDPPDKKTSYDIRATRRILVSEPVHELSVSFKE